MCTVTSIITPPARHLLSIHLSDNDDPWSDDRISTSDVPCNYFFKRSDFKFYLVMIKIQSSCFKTELIVSKLDNATKIKSVFVICEPHTLVNMVWKYLLYTNVMFSLIKKRFLLLVEITN